MSVDWDDLVKVFLHDPPDKAFGVQGHEQRARRYLEAALGTQVSRRQIKRLAGMPDQLAAVAERLPMPSAGELGERAVNPGLDGQLIVRHPLNPDELVISGRIDEDQTAAAIRDVVAGIEDPRQRFLALWRLLPQFIPWSLRLPAETRVPDHTLWHHADTAAAHYAALSESGTRGFLSFAIGPVQPFVAAARSVRDLWTGSAILSWLTFQAMLPVIESLGPTALVFPSLRGAPVMDLWLRSQGVEQVPLPALEGRKAPSIPNRFLALVPWAAEGRTGQDLANRCEESARQEWNRLAAGVREALDPQLNGLCPHWASRCDEQVASFFEIRTVTLPTSGCTDSDLAGLLGGASFADTWPHAGAVRNLDECMPEDHRPPYDQKDAGRWQMQVEFAGRLLEAARHLRHIPPSTSASKEYANKCTLFGSYEQMGPGDLGNSAEFWREAAKSVAMGGVRLGKRDRFCAVALAKRFAAPVFLAKELGLQADDIRIPDTWTVASARWLQRAGVDWTMFGNSEGQRWNGQWLHWRRRHDDKDEDSVPDATWETIKEARECVQEKPPVYYAILKMDADDIGRWLRGEQENMPTVREILHPRTQTYFEGLADTVAVTTALDAKRPVGPALHAAISEALANFAVHVVPSVVAKHAGTVIYAGGDDTLALLPVETALCCAWELRQAFSGLPPVNGFADPGYWRREDGRELLVMGPRASLSAGLAVLHAKDDLREGLEMARQAEKAAKTGGRNALVLTLQRRSGERTSALAGWDTVKWLDEMREAFAAGASDRWAYRLREEQPTLGALPFATILAEVRRQVDRSEKPTRERLGGGDDGKAGARIAETLGEYGAIRRQRRGNVAAGDAFADFLTLCQSASFLARGRD